MNASPSTNSTVIWNKGRLVGRKRPFRVRDIWAIRVRLQLAGKVRELALFNLAIDSKLRGCDLVGLKVSDILRDGEVATRATVWQSKTQRPVQFEITDETRQALTHWMSRAHLESGDFLFPSRLRGSPHITTRQYARLVKNWAREAGLDPTLYGTHTLRRTKAALIYRQTHNLRAVQLLLGHTKLESTVRYLGIELDDALEIAEHVEI